LEITLFCAGWAVRLGKQTIDFLRNGKPLSVKRCNMICNFESHQVFFYRLLPIEIFSYFQPWLASSCAEKIEKLDILLKIKINKIKRKDVIQSTQGKKIPPPYVNISKKVPIILVEPRRSLRILFQVTAT